MKTWKRYCLGLTAIAGLTPALMAQPAVVAAGAAAAPAPAAGCTLGGFFGITPEKKAKCKAKLCAMPLVQAMQNGLRMPMGMAGLGDPCCCPLPPGAPGAKPTDDQTKAPGAAGAAAKIQKDEAEAKARRIAVRYLGTVDCHWWPEAEMQLIGALRADRNECVRFEAALALGRGCCCTKKTIQALTISVEASEKDGNPSENSERVKAAAFFALQGCLARVETAPEAKPPEAAPKPPEPPAALKDAGAIQLTGFYEKANSKTIAQVVQEARRVLDAQGNGVPAAAPLHTGERSLSGVLRFALTTQSSPQEVVGNGGPIVYDGTSIGPKPTLATRLSSMSANVPSSRVSVRDGATMQVESQQEPVPVKIVRTSNEYPQSMVTREPAERFQPSSMRRTEPVPSSMGTRETSMPALMPRLARSPYEAPQPLERVPAPTTIPTRDYVNTLPKVVQTSYEAAAKADASSGPIITREPPTGYSSTLDPVATPVTREAPKTGLLPRMFGR